MPSARRRELWIAPPCLALVTPHCLITHKDSTVASGMELADTSPAREGGNPQRWSDRGTYIIHPPPASCTPAPMPHPSVFVSLYHHCVCHCSHVPAFALPRDWERPRSAPLLSTVPSMETYTQQRLDKYRLYSRALSGVEPLAPG